MSDTQGGVASIVSVGYEVNLGKKAGLLKVAVGDGAGWVVKRDQAALDLVREWLTPNVGDACCVKVHAPMPALAASVAPRRLGS